MTAIFRRALWPSLCLGVLGSLTVAPALSAQPGPAEAEMSAFEPVADGVFVSTSEFAGLRSVLIIGEDRAMLVDPGLTERSCEQLLARAAEVTSVPVEHVVWTCYSTRSALAALLDRRRWMTPGLRRAIVDQAQGRATDPAPFARPTEGIADEVIDLGDTSVRLRAAFTGGPEVRDHSTEVVVDVDDGRVLIVPPYLGEAFVPPPSSLFFLGANEPAARDYASWADFLETCLRDAPATLVVTTATEASQLEATVRRLREAEEQPLPDQSSRAPADSFEASVRQGYDDRHAAFRFRSIEAPSRRRSLGDLGRAPHQIGFGSLSSDGSWFRSAIAVAGSDRVATAWNGQDLNTENRRVAWPSEGTPLGVAFLPDHDLMVTQFGRDSIVRLRDGAVVETLEVGAGPSLIQGPLPGDRVLISCEGSDELVVVDGRQFEVFARYPTGRRPFPAAATSDGRLAFVPNFDDGTVTVIDLWNERVVDTVEVGERPTGVTMIPGDVECVVACRGSDELVWLNTASRLIERRRSVGAGPFSVVVDETRGLLYVNHTEDDSIGVLTMDGTAELLVEFPTGDLPICMALSPRDDQLWVSHENSHEVRVYELDSAEFGSRRAPAAFPPQHPPEALGVLGMIHRGHRTSEVWGTEELETTIRAFRPDVVLTEIPPDRWQRIWTDKAARDVYEDPRIQPFVEYTDMLLPLKVELGFAIEPCAGWTTEMNDLRKARIAEFESSEASVEQRAAYEEASRIAEEQTTLCDTEDPLVIHTDAYDRAMAIRLGPYDAYLNEHIGPGGWTNINRAHADLIEAAVRRHPGQRVLITFGAGHKYWIQNRLRQLGYSLEDMRNYLPSR